MTDWDRNTFLGIVLLCFLPAVVGVVLIALFPNAFVAGCFCLIIAFLIVVIARVVIYKRQVHGFGEAEIKIKRRVNSESPLGFKNKGVRLQRRAKQRI